MAKKNFEDSLTKLEEITSDLENGELSLEGSLKKFDEAMKLADYCNQKLHDAQKKVNLLLNRDGELTKQPFSDSSNQ